MRITRTNTPTEGAKQDPGDLEGLTLKGLQWELTKLTGHDTVEKNRASLIRRITELRQQKEADAKAKANTEADAATPPPPERLEDMTTEQLQRTLNVLTTRRTLERDRAVLIRMISRMREKQQEKLEAQADAEIETEAEKPTQTTTQRLVAIANMKLPALRDEYQRVCGKPSLSRNRKSLLVKIASRLQADEAAPESPIAPLAKPTLIVKFERKGGKKSSGKGKRGSKAKAVTKGKETATKRETAHPAGQQDPRLPKVGTTIERLYKRKKLLVTVTEDGFTFNGKPYRSLSALAQVITGSAAINGYLFFRLGKYAKKEKAGK